MSGRSAAGPAGRSALLALFLAATVSGCAGNREEPRSASRQDSARYTVQAGDTLSAIARRYGIDMRALAAANGLAPPYLIRIGQQLNLPRPLPAAPSSRRDARGQARAAPRPVPAPPPPPPLATVPAPPPRPPVRPAPVAPMPPPPGAPRLAWPADGPVSQPFGQGGSGTVLIAAHPGAAVRSAAAGTVLYAGDEPTAAGRRVQVDHGNGWVTVYRHLGRLVVQPGEKVARGARIGFVAPPGRALGATLGFELRRGEQPFDPLPLMPPRF